METTTEEGTEGDNLSSSSTISDNLEESTEGSESSKRGESGDIIDHDHTQLIQTYKEKYSIGISSTAIESGIPKDFVQTCLSQPVLDIHEYVTKIQKNNAIEFERRAEQDKAAFYESCAKSIDAELNKAGFGKDSSMSFLRKKIMQEAYKPLENYSYRKLIDMDKLKAFNVKSPVAAKSDETNKQQQQQQQQSPKTTPPALIPMQNPMFQPNLPAASASQSDRPIHIRAQAPSQEAPKSSTGTPNPGIKRKSMPQMPQQSQKYRANESTGQGISRPASVASASSSISSGVVTEQDWESLSYNVTRRGSDPLAQKKNGDRVLSVPLNNSIIQKATQSQLKEGSSKTFGF